MLLFGGCRMWNIHIQIYVYGDMEKNENTIFMYFHFIKIHEFYLATKLFVLREKFETLIQIVMCN